MASRYSIEQITTIFFPLFQRVAVKKAVLFGSYARGEATDASDIDIFLDSGGKLRGLKFIGFCEQLEEAAQKPVEVIEKFEIDTSSKLFQIISAEGITIYGE